MNPARCLACLRTAARAARTSALPRLAPTVSTPRRLHAFAPTPPLLKKKRGGAVEADFDDFMADEIEPDLDEPTPAVSSTKASGLGRTERHALVSSEIKKIVAYSSYRLRAFTPSPMLLITLFNTTTPEEIDSDIDLVAQWRSKGLPVTGPALEAFLARCTKHNMPEKAVTVLADRAKYGFELTQSDEADILFLHLAQAAIEEGRGPKRVDAASTLLALEKLFLPEGGSFATTCTILSMINNGAQNATTALLLKDLQKMGVDSVTDDINSRSDYKRMRVVSRLETAQSTLEAAGQKSEAAFLGKVLAQITPAKQKSSRKPSDREA